MDDKRQITVTFAVSCTGKFLPIQLIYAGKTERSLFRIFFFGNVHRKSLAKHREICWIFERSNFPLEQHALIIIYTFKGQDNNTLKKLCAENNCEIVTVPHNFTNTFQPLDLSVNKAAKSFI